LGSLGEKGVRGVTLWGWVVQGAAETWIAGRKEEREKFGGIKNGGLKHSSGEGGQLSSTSWSLKAGLDGARNWQPKGHG